MDYFASDHFAANYWSPNYFGATAGPTSGNWWQQNYWSGNYWASNYWADVSLTDPVGLISATVGLLDRGSGYFSLAYYAADYFNAQYLGRTRGSEWIGSFDAPVLSGGFFAGSVGVSGAFQGDVRQVQYVDLTVPVSIVWTIQEYAGFAGDVAGTLDDFTSSMAGTFTAAGAVLGTVALTLDSVTSALDGTHVAPANFVGSISTTLSEEQGFFDGTFIEPGAFIGSLATSLDGIASGFEGSVGTSATSGTIAGEVDFSTSWRANYYPAGVLVGYFYADISVSGSFVGESIGDQIVRSGPPRPRAVSGVSVRRSSGRLRVSARKGRA